MSTINLGDVLTCAETGKQFVAAPDGCSRNYATGRDGSILSDEGVHIRQCHELLDHTLPFSCYVSGDGKRVTGWKGNTLGTVTHSSTSRTGWHGSTLLHVQVTDVHGARWHGKGSGAGMYIRLHACKGGAAWEGEPIVCAHSGRLIESAYGVPENEGGAA
jgi:hypothetical protein